MPHRSPLIQIGKTLILIGIVAGMYFLLGLLGLLFRIPSAPIGIFMPSAGLALAATLLFGMRILPAIAIGNFCVSAWFFDFNQAYLPFYVANAIGTTLSAWIGASLVRKMIGFPDPLVEGRKIILFMCLGGPVSCLVSAVIGITAMHRLGIIALADIPLSWLSWWIADILGVLIFTPLILILFAKPQHVWYRRRATVGLPIVFTFALVIVLFFYLNGIAREQYTQQLKEKAITLSQALKNRIQLDLSSLYAIRNYLLGSQAIEPKEFSLLTKQTLMPFKEMQAISWVNITEDKVEKSQFITALNEQAHNKTETLRLILPDLRKKLQESPLAATTEFLIPEQNGFKLLIPIAKGRDQDKKELGVIAASLSIEGIVQQALAGLNTSHCAMKISTTQEALPDEKIIYSNIDSNDQTPYQTIPIQVADQTWLLSFYHDWGREKAGEHWPIGKIIFSGLWFTAILGIVLLHLTGRYFRTEAIIEERTKILMETKIAAEQANEAKNQFLAKISHELRTPLNGISGFTQLLEKKPTLSAEDKKQVAIIKQCSDDLLRLINDILDISAIETQQIKLEISDFNFTPLLTDSIRICKFRADEKGLTLITKNTCLPRKFLGDEKRIRQILVNLIDNAVKYTNQGSVTVDTSYQAGNLNISITDTGCGIAQNDLERIFSPFVQIGANNFTREGIGLGLSITKELISLMNGELTVSSQLGVGSVFAVSLPLPVNVKNQAKAALYPNDIDPKFNEVYVLVVDDSTINLLFLVSMLKQIGCKVDSAMDGLEALALIQQNNYDLALIDINMPVMNGLELVKRLRSQQINLKVAALSAYADSDKINEALNAGIDIYLTKPIEEYQLIELVQASLRSRNQTDQDFSLSAIRD
jgi:signal transduction histidine kinase/ActR/RegA family two-component response regulator